MSVNQRLKFLRTSKGLEISQVEKTTGITASNIYGYESSVVPRPAKLKLLADFYGVTIEYLMNGDEKLPQVSPQVSAEVEMLKKENSTLKDQVKQLMEMVNNLTNSINMLSNKLGKLEGNCLTYAETEGKIIPLVAESVAHVAKRAA